MPTHYFPKRALLRLTVLLCVGLAYGCGSEGVVVQGAGTGYSRACVDSGQNVIICPATSMARVTRSGDIPFEHPDYDWSNDGAVELYGARNETIAFQLIFQIGDGPVPADVDVRLTDLIPDSADSTVIGNGFSQSLYTAFYHPLDNAGYTYGPKTEVLPWPGSYPDALIPAHAHCQGELQISTAELDGNQSQLLEGALPQPLSLGRGGASLRISLSDQVDLDQVEFNQANRNQAIWVDTYINKDVPAGRYRQMVEVTVNGELLQLPLHITVHNTTLPDEPSIDAVTEAYRTYESEGVGFDRSSPLWRRMSACYQQLAHQHRMVLIERIPDLLEDEQLEAYADVIDPVLTGELFSEASGYIGPGRDLPVSVWRTPWPQQYNGRLQTALTNEEVLLYRQLATDWTLLASERGWNSTDFFAYVFDEIDGPSQLEPNPDSYAQLAHQQISRVQSAIDSAGGAYPIDLIWTSHSNPARWQGIAGADLTGTVRLWAPNGSAADVPFLQQRISEGEKAWFYHSGHPAVGAHSINVSGIELRTWGVIGARYGFQGQFMWAANLTSREQPFMEPTYIPDDDRAGNGILIYPGNQLDKIGFARQPGPVPSMRLKAWRRGLQDAEIYYLARLKSQAAADALIRRQMPAALTEGRNGAAWSSNPADWVEFRKALLTLAAG